MKIMVDFGWCRIQSTQPDLMRDRSSDCSDRCSVYAMLKLSVVSRLPPGISFRPLPFSHDLSLDSQRPPSVYSAISSSSSSKVGGWEGRWCRTRRRWALERSGGWVVGVRTCMPGFDQGGRGLQVRVRVHRYKADPIDCRLQIVSI